MKKLRKEFNRLIEKYGLTHPIVIEYSNKLNNAILPIQIKREFDVNSYKAIKRRYLEDVLDIVEKYRLTIALKEQIGILNNQVIWE